MVFVLRMSAMICAPSTFNSLPPKLRTRAKRTCQRLLTVKASAGKGAAYSREVRLWLMVRACAIAFAPSSPILLPKRLPRKHAQTQAHQAHTMASTSARQHARCQRPLTHHACFLTDVLAFVCAFLGRLYQNDIGDEGAKAIGEALATNQSLTSLEYAAPL